MKIGIEHIPFNLALRRARQRKGWSRRALAAEAGSDPTSIGRYEALKAWPNEGRATQIAFALGTPIDELFPESLGDIVRRTPAQRLESEWVVPLLSATEPLLLSDAFTETVGLAESLDEAMDSLSPKQQEVLERHFGLHGRGSETFEQIAETWGVTRERVRQVEMRALTKMRHPTRSGRIRDYAYTPSDPIVEKQYQCGTCRDLMTLQERPAHVCDKRRIALTRMTKRRTLR